MPTFSKKNRKKTETIKPNELLKRYIFIERNAYISLILSIRQNMKKNKWIFIAALFIMCLSASSCTKTEEEHICELAEKFGNLYFNHQIRESKIYCTYEMQPIMDFRASNLIEQEIELLKSQKLPATVKAIRCDLQGHSDLAYVSLEVKNFLRTDYLKDSAFMVKCDTIDIIFSKDFADNWKIKSPF